jgi:outer membrane protein assembly factor BamB
VTGTTTVTAFDMEGTKVWSRNLRKDYGNLRLNWGYASSPLLLDGKLIIEVLQGYGEGGSYVVAFDALTGKEVWKKERPTDAIRESPDAYTTPALMVVDGKKQFVINGGDYVTAHDAETGTEVWRAAGLNPRRAQNYRIISSVTVKDGMIFAPTRQRPLLALRAGGKGDVTESHVAWKYEEEGAPDVPSPLSDGTYFYMVADNGSVTCVEAKTGKRVWGPERTAVGTVSASPVLADGKIYITNEKAITTVVSAGPEFKNIGTNELDGSYTLSSPAIAGKNIFVRTSQALYCIGE